MKTSKSGILLYYPNRNDYRISTPKGFDVLDKLRHLSLVLNPEFPDQRFIIYEIILQGEQIFGISQCFVKHERLILYPVATPLTKLKVFHP